MQKKFSKNGQKNMEYRIKLSQNFLTELEEIFEYIEKDLKAPLAANRLRYRIMIIIQRLKDSPKIYSKINNTDRFGRVYRRFLVDNYAILYTIIQEDNVILISHIYYGGKNYLNRYIFK